MLSLPNDVDANSLPTIKETQEEIDAKLVVDNSKYQKEADKLRYQYTEEQWNMARRMAKHNLLFLARGVLGNDKLSPSLHAHFCEWHDKTRHMQWRLVLMPRGHYKTTLETIAGTIQLALPDVGGGSPYPYNLGPDGRNLIVHRSDRQASRFLYLITQHFRQNPMMLMLFPECVPVKGKQRINATELDLPRTREWSEPSIDTMGVGSQSQGRHYSQIKPDDIYGRDDRDSKASTEMIIDWNGNLQSFLITPKTDHITWSGTRYGFHDVYGKIIETYTKAYGDKFAKYIRSALERNPKTGEMEPIFPESFDKETFVALRENPLAWIQYTNNPKPGDLEFKSEYIQYYDWIGPESRDPDINSELAGFATDGPFRHSVRSLDRLIFFDPATKHQCGIVVTGTDSKSPHHRIFALESIQKSLSTDSQADLIFKLVEKWKPRAVVIENVLFSELYANWLPLEMQKRRTFFRIELCSTRNKAKEDRVRGLIPYFSGMQFFTHRERCKILNENIRDFGAIEDYHDLDALAMGPHYWRSAPDEDIIYKRLELQHKIQGARDPLTGYSRIR